MRLYAIAAAALLLFGFAAGWYVNGVRWSNDWLQADARAASAQAKQEQLAAELQREQSLRLSSADKAALLERALADAEGETIIKEVVRYVQSDVAGDCRLPDSWVRIHNTAAGLPAAASTAAVANGASKTITTDSDALPVITTNYRACRAAITRLHGLQGWVGALQ